jgi:four helix bundle protein
MNDCDRTQDKSTNDARQFLKEAMNNKQHNYEKLKIWEDGINLAVDIFQITKSLPDEEKFGMINQMRRAGYSVSSNIAEGESRNSDKSFNQFLNISQGSLGELHTQTIICNRIGYLSENDSMQLISEIKKIKTVSINFKQL